VEARRRVRTVLDEMILGESEEALSRSESLSDEHGGGVGDLLSLERSPLDDAVEVRIKRKGEGEFSKGLLTRGREGGEGGARARTDYWRRAGRTFCSRGFWRYLYLKSKRTRRRSVHF